MMMRLRIGSRGAVRNLLQKSPTSAQDFCEPQPVENAQTKFFGIGRANVSTSAYPLMTSVDAPSGAREIFWTAWHVGRVLTSVRPLMRPGAAGPYGSSKIESKSVRRDRSAVS